jgi:beta-N-acetylhexosaminidase
LYAIHNGQPLFTKAFGYTTYDSVTPVTLQHIYDLASVTKITATTLGIMKLYEQKRIVLTDVLSKYLPWLQGTNKAKLTIKDVLLHQAGMVPFIPFYKNVIDSNGAALPQYISTTRNNIYTIPVAKNCFLHNGYADSMRNQIILSKVDSVGLKYVYSDNDFILLGNIIESITGKKLNTYVAETFYNPLQATTVGFLPLQRFATTQIVPTEKELIFRKQLLHGYVHDPGAAMMGGVAGHAGLFGAAPDIAKIYTMLAQGGVYGGKRYFNKSTISYFTSYHSFSRRGLGFDKPEKDNAIRKEPYPSAMASSNTFGHTGFTGTCVWVDPAKKLVYIFLSNRVYDKGGDNKKLLQLNIRGRIMDALYKMIEK